MKERICNLCRLSSGCSGPVWGDGDPKAPLHWWGEAPGREEDLRGIPFVGKAGVESNQYKSRYGLRLLPQYTSNVVKCRPPKNRDPKPPEIDACMVHMREEAALIPEDCVIATLGRFSTEAFLGHAEMDMMYAIPHRHPMRRGWIIVPIYHPALGLYDGRWMTQIDEGYKAVADVLNGTIKPEDWEDEFPNPDYRLFEGWSKPQPEVIAVDTENGHSGVWSLQFSCQPGESFFVKASDNDGLSVLRSWADSTVFIMHNAQHDLEALRKLGIEPSKWMDTMLVANVATGIPRGLKPLAFRLAGMKMKTYREMVTPYDDERILPYIEEVASIEWPQPDQVVEIVDGQLKEKQPQPLHTKAQRILKDYAKDPDKVSPYDRWFNIPVAFREPAVRFLGEYRSAMLEDIPFERAMRYACRDSDATLRIYPKVYQRVEAMGLTNVLDLDQGIVPLLARMERVGTKVDVAELRSFQAELIEDKKKAMARLKSIAGYWVNPGSSKQVEHLLYGKLRLKRPKRKPEQANYTTSQDHLLKIDHPAVSEITTYRGADKLLGSFVNRLLAMRDRNDRIHDDISQIRTVSGRLAASIMLLIPKKGEGGKKLRKCFVSEEGRSIVSIDYSQMELRVLADLSQDTNMLKVYREGGDIHAQTAALIWGVPHELQDPVAHRRPAKVVNFGIVYGFTAEGLLDELEPLGYSLEDCERLIKNWFRAYPGAKDFMSRMHLHARRFGFVASPSGRRRLIPEVRSALPYIRNRGLRQAGNFPIQTHASDIMKKAMSKIYNYILEPRDFYLECLIQVHDDLKFEVDSKHATSTARRIVNLMNGAGDLCIPLVSEAEVGACWSEMEALNGNE